MGNVPFNTWGAGRSIEYWITWDKCQTHALFIFILFENSKSSSFFTIHITQNERLSESCQNCCQHWQLCVVTLKVVKVVNTDNLTMQIWYHEASCSVVNVVTMTSLTVKKFSLSIWQFIVIVTSDNCDVVTNKKPIIVIVTTLTTLTLLQPCCTTNIHKMQGCHKVVNALSPIDNYRVVRVVTGTVSVLATLQNLGLRNRARGLGLGCPWPKVATQGHPALEDQKV